MTETASPPSSSSALLRLDPTVETERIESAVRNQVFGQLRRKGVVVGISGGIDSSVAAALSVRAVGAEKVLGLFMPEHDSASESLSLGRLLAEHLGIDTVLEDVAPLLEAAGCYRRRDEAIRSVFPDYGPGYASKIVLPDLFDDSPYRIFSLVIQSPDG
ncbi:MAG: NAD(+) synthase, partial [Planctomycetes bacterium]|nr:NAD(+) synthase [Planctomycetota bacterium]